MNLQLSKKESHRAVAPIIATLILVAIAVVGGVMIFVFAQDFFGGESMTGPGTIDQLTIAGYDFRDAAANSIKSHNGTAATGTAGSSGNFDAGDHAAIYLRNSGAADIQISTVRVADALLSYKSVAPATLAAGEYTVYVDNLAGTLTLQTSPTIAAGETGTIFFENNTVVKNGRTVSIDVTTGSGQSFSFSAVVGQES